MVLSAFVAGVRSAIFEDLKSGNAPKIGDFEPDLFRKLASKGAPQLGSIRYEPGALALEFIYPEPGQGSTVFEVRVTPPERVVFMPVPNWVVESVWEGEVTGSYRFESEANELLNEFASSLSPEQNPALFRRKLPTGRG